MHPYESYHIIWSFSDWDLNNLDLFANQAIEDWFRCISRFCYFFIENVKLEQITKIWSYIFVLSPKNTMHNKDTSLWIISLFKDSIPLLPTHHFLKLKCSPCFSIGSGGTLSVGRKSYWKANRRKICEEKVHFSGKRFKFAFTTTRSEGNRSFCRNLCMYRINSLWSCRVVDCISNSFVGRESWEESREGKALASRCEILGKWNVSNYSLFWPSKPLNA